ncbi:MAG TPA: PH domain-containing protein [Pseudogracilibacillus sp.]|nr:PH domain-containing protein [Pseudogracilibacillus sp.]
MRAQPRNQIAKDAIKVWRIHALIYIFILWIFIILLGLGTFLFSLPVYYIGIAVILGLILFYVFVLLMPKLRYRRWRYEIFEQEIYIQHGILIVRRTIIPMIRVQHVDTVQGPILKRYDLATVSISTAATVHEIPALYEADAENLRDRLSTLARVDEEDV